MLQPTETAIKQPTSPNLPKRLLTMLGNLIFACLMLIMMVLVFFLIKSNLDGGHPSIAGHNIYVVLSGSMAPAFDAGSVVIVKPFPAEEVAVGDVITYKDTEDNTTLVTHRVAAISPENDLAFTTRGDANNSDDHTPVPAANLVGKVQMAVPYAGYIVDFARTKQGLLAMVIVPGILIIIFELRNLMICAEALEKEKKAKQAKRIAEQIEPQSCSIQPKEVTAAETNDV